MFELFGSYVKVKEQEPVALELEHVESDSEQCIIVGASSDEEYLDDYEYEEVAGDLQNVTEGRIYVLNLSNPPEEGKVWLSDEDVFYGLVEKVFCEKKIKVKILDLVDKCPKSNMGYLRKTG